MLSDHGAGRDLARALAEGVRGHVADLRRRLPKVERLIVQVDEPMLPAVLEAGVPTASGFGRHRTVHPPEASAALEIVLAAISDAGAEPWVHSCAPGVPWALVAGAGARGLSVDHTMLGAKDFDALATALDDGLVVGLGVVPSTDPVAVPTEKVLAEQVLRWLDMLGLDPADVRERLVITPSCGLAGASPDWGRRALSLSHDVASHL
ncbi:hypothetical protein [Nocardioides sp. B-3]|uniref:hypothetical protein n=1 Tax=Nocardioides sp. B-3 TaxID=2895565 RepID=UPI002153572A|nr:hypothetical protein [Nocardioides sp. B-3]UUZ59996.1 hypothetical protein LP418_02965 [Nocardioides sp. B-3]